MKKPIPSLKELADRMEKLDALHPKTTNLLHRMTRQEKACKRLRALAEKGIAMSQQDRKEWSRLIDIIIKTQEKNMGLSL